MCGKAVNKSVAWMIVRLSLTPLVVFLAIEPGVAQAGASNLLMARMDYGTGSLPYSAALGDLDGDGDLDMLVSNHSDKDLSVWKNNSNGGFAQTVSYRTGWRQPDSVALGDLDGDGDLDLVVTDGKRYVSVFKNRTVR